MLGFVINSFITSNIVTMFFQEMDSLYVLLSIIVLIMKFLFIFITMRLCRTKKVNIYVFKFLFSFYIGIMLILLFGREIRDTAISITIYLLFNFLDFEVLFQNIFNAILFFL